MCTPRSLALAGALVLAATLPALAQLPTYGLGRAPTAEEIKAWDLTIPPDGRGLPPGSGTATAGKTVFVERCASCHGPKGEDEETEANDENECSGPPDVAQPGLGLFGGRKFHH